MNQLWALNSMQVQLQDQNMSKPYRRLIVFQIFVPIQMLHHAPYFKRHHPFLLILRIFELLIKYFLVFYKFILISSGHQIDFRLAARIINIFKVNFQQISSIPI